MKRVLIFLCILAAGLLGLPTLAEESGNLIQNGDFSMVDASGLPTGWTREMWYTDSGVSKLFVASDGYEGHAAEVVNADANDARFTQTVAVEPDSVYRMSCLVRAEACGEEGYGATISIDGTFVYSNEVFDTAGDWETLTLYGRTGPEQTSVTLMLRVGGYGRLNTGSACFDNVEMVRLDAAPEDVEVYSLVAQESSASGSSSAAEEADAEPARSTETYLLLAALYALFILAVARKQGRSGNAQCPRAALYLGIGLGIALLLRLVLAFRVRGYYTDLNCFGAWSERIFSTGLTNFYAEDYFCDYPPGYMLLLWPVALLRSLTGAEYLSTAHILLLKLIPILCDLAGAGLIWRFGKKRGLDMRATLLFALLYAFNPAAIIDSAAWAQIDSVFTLLIVLCAIQAAGDRYISALLAFAAAVLIKPQAMLFAPLGLFAILINLVRSGSRKKLREFVLAVVSALALLYLCALPFCAGSAQGFADLLTRPVRWLVELYGSTMGSYRYLTLNALNLYELLGFNWSPTTAHPIWNTLAWCGFGAAYLYSGWLYLKAKDGKKLLLCGAVLIALIYTFGPMIHERYIFPALLLLTLACLETRDRRLLVSLTVMTTVTALNEILVLQGGMTAANYGHLQSSEQWLNAILSLLNVANALYLSWVAYDLCVFGRVHRLAAPAPETAPQAELRLHERADYRLRLGRFDALAMAAVTLVYAVCAFTNLGVTSAPQTSWVASRSGEAVTFDLGDTQTFRMTYYGGICNSTFTVELSNDGNNWTDPKYAQYDQGEIFRWLYYVPMNAELSVLYDDTLDPGDGSAFITYATSENAHPFQTARYVRITAQSAGLTLSEFGFWTAEGALLPVSAIQRTGELAGFETDPQALIDEQDTVPEAPSYLNSTYFDEIYHARTAYELAHGEYVYEWTHPPLGKVLMMVGIQLFGMTPFGWRFMGALVGVLMLPLMYLLAKQLTKSSKLSFVAMALMALDSMHFTQTRIATIDSYAVFWIMLMYLFMFRYAQMNWNREKFSKTLIPLGLCGITMGIAWATKWIGIYASAGLAIILFWTLIQRYLEMRQLKKSGGDEAASGRFARNTLATIGFCLVFFIVIPLMIYYFSYYWQLKYEGVSSFGDMLRPQWLKRVIELQQTMFKYHAGLGGDTHYFRSPWYQWPVIWWPMWYYSGTAYMPSGMISSISCMGNPAVWWGGLIALISTTVLTAWRRRAPKVWILVLIGFASQFLPWVLVPRSTFIYHYFASVPFIILMTVLMLGEIAKAHPRGARTTTAVLLALALVLFIAFYPLESGLPVSRAYANCLRWFKWYNF